MKPHGLSYMWDYAERMYSTRSTCQNHPIFSNQFRDFFKYVDLSTFDIALDAFDIFKVLEDFLNYLGHLNSVGL